MYAYVHMYICVCTLSLLIECSISFHFTRYMRTTKAISEGNKGVVSRINCRNLKVKIIRTVYENVVRVDEYSNPCFTG